jgi:hypothetical protein
MKWIAMGRRNVRGFNAVAKEEEEWTAGGAHSQFSRVTRQLNERSRETLGFETRAERFNACVASTD